MKKYILVILFICFGFVKPATAYYTSMPASVVVGQQNFTSGLANQGGTANANTLNTPQGVYYDPVSKKLFIVDSSNHRVLIYNNLPTTNNAAADVVVGQANFTSNSANRGGSVAANTLNSPLGVTVIHGKLYIADGNNHRVLIFNTIPTTNGASADLVIGQANFTSGLVNHGFGLNNPAANTLAGPTNIASDGTKLIITDQSNMRVLIYNTLPTTNDVFADVVLGQSTFTTRVSNQGGIGANTFANPTGLLVVGGKLLVGDVLNFRVLVWNSIPTTNKSPADVVIGQPNFTSNGGQVFGLNTRRPMSLAYDGKRLLIAHDFSGVISIRNNGVPTTNFSPQDAYLGLVNQTPLQNNTFWEPRSVTTAENKIIVADSLHYHRVLIFNNDALAPNLALSNQPETREGGLQRLQGTAKSSELYKIKSVEYSVNGGGWSGTTALDGGFDEVFEDFYFDYDSKSNNTSKEGFVVQVKAKNNNTDEVDRLTYFEPFRLNNPDNNARSDNQLPVFSFTVNSQRQLLYEGLQKYMVMIKKGKADWTTYADEIPVNYDYAKDKAENTAEKKSNTDGNGIYEDSKIKVTYSEDGARLEVFSKEDSKKLSGGSYQWKVVAVDKAGHTQETGTRYLRMNADESEAWFPLTIEFITGIGKTNISTVHERLFSKNYFTTVSDPTFSGTAVAGSTVTFTLTEKNCSADQCTFSAETITDSSSKYSIKLPANSIKLGKKYNLLITVYLDDQYNELPELVLSRKSKK